MERTTEQIRENTRVLNAIELLSRNLHKKRSCVVIADSTSVSRATYYDFASRTPRQSVVNRTEVISFRTGSYLDATVLSGNILPQLRRMYRRYRNRQDEMWWTIKQSGKILGKCYYAYLNLDVVVVLQG